MVSVLINMREGQGKRGREKRGGRGEKMEKEGREKEENLEHAKCALLQEGRRVTSRFYVLIPLFVSAAVV